jgi:hypothetical protein
MKVNVNTDNPLLQIHKLMDLLSPEDLMFVAKAAQQRANNATKIALKIGDEVQFDAKSRGLKRGILIKKNPKTFQVLVGSVTWKVSPTLLKKAA